MDYYGKNCFCLLQKNYIDHEKGIFFYNKITQLDGTHRKRNFIEFQGNRVQQLKFKDHNSPMKRFDIVFTITVIIIISIINNYR